MRVVVFILCLLSFILPAQARPIGDPVFVDRVVVYKNKRQMDLLSQGKVLRSYKIALGKNPQGHKRQEGDEKTPEGLYKIDLRNQDSKFHLSLRISYPNDQDKKRARAKGVKPGGDIFIHGLKNGSWIWGSLQHRTSDNWTNGCIAVSNTEIEEIWHLVQVGTPIEILP